VSPQVSLVPLVPLAPLSLLEEALLAAESHDRLARDFRIMIILCFSSSSSLAASLNFLRFANSDRVRYGSFSRARMYSLRLAKKMKTKTRRPVMKMTLTTITGITHACLWW